MPVEQLPLQQLVTPSTQGCPFATQEGVGPGKVGEAVGLSPPPEQEPVWGDPLQVQPGTLLQSLFTTIVVQSVVVGARVG